MQTIPGEFGITLITGPADRPDPTPAEREAARRADRIGYREMLRSTFGDDESAFVRAKGFHFPASLGNFLPTGGGWGIGEAFYSRAAIAAWKKDVLDFAKTLK
jgi:hypothetical protein